MQNDYHIPVWRFWKIKDWYFLGFAGLICLSQVLVVVFSTWSAWIFCVLARPIILAGDYLLVQDSDLYQQELSEFCHIFLGVG